MSTEPCNRVNDALAAGNVWGDAALLEHAKDCEVCTNELAALKKRRDFRDAFPVLSSIADEAKRPSTRARSNTDDAKVRGSRRHLFIMIAALIVIIGYVTRGGPFREEAAPRPVTDTTAPPRFRISNLENAVFESKVEGATVRASMARGMAAFHVEQLGPRQRFLVNLPDGDLEVRGTRFVVTVENGKTQLVDVAEGAVALHLKGRDEILLSAGQRWPAESGRPTVSFMRLAPTADAAAPTEPSKPDR